MKGRIRKLKREKGMALFISLAMLVTLTLIVVSAIRMGTVNLRIAGNMQRDVEAVAAGQIGIEKALNSTSNFYTPVAHTYTVTTDAAGTASYTVQVLAPVCQSIQPVAGFSADFAAAAPQDSFWDITATVTDNLSGASIELHQGVKIRLDSTGTCP